MLRYLPLFYKNFLYDLFNVTAGLFFLFFMFMQLRKTKTLGIYCQFLLRNKDANSKWHSLAAAFEAFILAFFVLLLPSETFTHPFARLFYNFTGKTGAVLYFGHLILIIPFFLFAAFLLGEKPSKTFDLITPGLSLSLIFMKFACFCQGCCNGIETKYGFFNFKSNRMEFPIQLVESAEALVIFLILMRIRKNAKVGTMFPLYIVFYCGMRFFSEFFRAQPDVLGSLKCAQLFCIGGIVFGAIGFIITERYGEKIDTVFDGIYSKIEAFLHKKFLKKNN